ncbi:MAG: hypothetical protein M3Z27_04145 [Actinomycetota bacterium]|nr:hypothetical protein [Actinomycetota bacterium]
MGIAGLGEREVDRGCREVVGLAGLVAALPSAEQICTARCPTARTEAIVGVEKTGLAKPPRARESDRHAIGGCALERIELEAKERPRSRLG